MKVRDAGWPRRGFPSARPPASHVPAPLSLPRPSFPVPAKRSWWGLKGLGTWSFPLEKRTGSLLADGPLTPAANPATAEPQASKVSDLSWSLSVLPSARDYCPGKDCLVAVEHVAKIKHTHARIFVNTLKFQIM